MWKVMWSGSSRTKENLNLSNLKSCTHKPHTPTPHQKAPDPKDFMGKFYQTLKDCIISLHISDNGKLEKKIKLF